MSRRAQLTVHVASGLLVAGSLGLWLATGREGFTRWPDERLARTDGVPADDEMALLADVGFGDASPAESRGFQSRFALGLLPGGADPGHLASVATACCVALLASAVASALAPLGNARS
jgi:hypothetical protein